MKGCKWYSLKKELQPFITGTSNYHTHHGQGHTQVKVIHRSRSVYFISAILYSSYKYYPWLWTMFR